MIIIDLPPKLILPEPPALIRPAPKPKLEFDYAGGFPAILTRRRHNQRGNFNFTFLDKNESGTGQNPFVFDRPETIGTTTAAHDVVCAIGHVESNGVSAATTNSCTIEGDSLTVIGQAEGTSSNESNATLCGGSIDGFTTGDVQFGLSAQTGRGGYILWEVEGLDTVATAASEASDEGTSLNTISITLTVGPTQVAFVCAVAAEDDPNVLGTWNVSFEELQTHLYAEGASVMEAGISFDSGTYTYTPDKSTNELALYGIVYDIHQ